MIAKKIVSREYIKDIPNWEKDYLKSMKGNLSEQQIELLEGRDIKADEGMIYGQMYSDWKRRAWDVE
tara:strand:- start:148 stop:348 length:201 start_codon:yes stop_codon:yes gene_type:complete